MKKKIGELTIREMFKICWDKENCSECPLGRRVSETYSDCKAEVIDKNNEQYLDQEVEVEE